MYPKSNLAMVIFTNAKYRSIGSYNVIDVKIQNTLDASHDKNGMNLALHHGVSFLFSSTCDNGNSHLIVPLSHITLACDLITVKHMEIVCGEYNL